MKNLKIEWVNENNFKTPAALERSIKTNLQQFFKILKINQNYQLTVNLVNSAKIKRLNLKYLNRNYQTDVLSFKSSIPIKSSLILAEIYICYPVAKKQAQESKAKILNTITFLALHGFLHILGFNHQAQQKILKNY